MSIGEGEPNRYIVIHPGTLSRAKRTGMNNGDPDFAWHPSVLVNEDKLCHQVMTATTKATSVKEFIGLHPVLYMMSTTVPIAPLNKPYGIQDLHIT
jgi:hypothetical protein